VVSALMAFSEKGRTSREITSSPAPMQCLRQLAPIIEARHIDVLCAQTSHGGKANP
jgi:hypothetical protein